ISAWNNNEIDDATMKMYLGDALWNQLGMPKKVAEYIKTTNNITLNNRVESIEVNVVKVSQSFSYTGNVQTFTAPVTGEYTLEVWGAEGGSYVNNGGKGGYATGTVQLTAGQTIYVVVGGAGGKGSPSYTNPGSGGYNGGGTGGKAGSGASGSGGGGATHIATCDGLLSSLASSKS